MEREAMEQINKNLGEIRAEYFKNRRFISKGEFKVPPEFELKGYDDEPATTTRPSAAETPAEPQPETLEPAPEQPTEEAASEPASTQPEAPENTETTAQAMDPEPAPGRAPRMSSRISSGLNGPHWNVGPLGSRRRYITAQVQFFETHGTHEGSPDNTEPVPDDEPTSDPETPEAPGQEEP